MKFYKRLVLNRKDPISSRFAVETDGRIVTNTTNSLELPAGDSSMRPGSPVNGQIRYNTALGTGELEAYINGSWQIIKTNRQAIITKSEFDNGDYADTLFGPLPYAIDTSKPQNVFVYVENVPQIPGLNYVLASGPISTSTTVTQIAPLSTTTLHVASVADFNPADPITGTNIAPGTTIVNTSATDHTITLSAGTSGSVATGTVVTTTLPAGTYIQFFGNSLPVPNKPVITLQGFDGYGYPFEA